MIRGEGKGIPLPNARLLRIVNNALPSNVFPSIPAQTGGGRPQKVRYPPSVSGEGVPKPFGLHRGPYNTLLSNLGGR